jgi:hypothetical protein
VYPELILKYLLSFKDVLVKVICSEHALSKNEDKFGSNFELPLRIFHFVACNPLP